MNQHFSYKLTNINFLLSIIIVFIHSSCFRFLSSSQQFVVIGYNSFVSTINSVAVPLFFCISSYLLYRNISEDNIKRKLKDRVKSLLIPYLAWNFIFYIYYKSLSMLPYVSSFADISMDLSFKHFIVNYFWNGFFHTSWFIRNLIIYTFLCPVIYYLLKLIKSNKIILFIILVFLFFVPVFTGANYSNPLYWLAIYFFGIIMATNYRESIENSTISKKHLFIMIFLFLGLVFYFCKFDQDSYYFYIYRMISPIPFYLLLSNLLFIYHKPFNISKISFFLIVIHVMIIQIINKLLIVFFNISPIKSILYSLISTISTLFIVYILFLLFSNLVPNIFRILIGGRGVKKGE